MFNILKNGSRSVLYSHQQYKRVPISLHPRHYLLFSGFIFLFLLIFFIVAIFTGVRWYLVVLIGSSLMISDVEHLFCVFIGHLCIFFGRTCAQVPSVQGPECWHPFS